MPKPTFYASLRNHMNVKDVPDPYYDGRFELVFELARIGSEGLLEKIRKDRKL